MAKSIMLEQNHQLAIKALCAKVDSHFFEVLANSAPAACYLLADLYCFRAKAKEADKSLLCATLVKLKKQLAPNHVALLWQSLGSVNSLEWNLLSRGAKQALTLLRKVMLRKKSYLQFIDTSALLELGQHPDWYREIFIALIRKHLWQQALVDPFIYPQFSYHLVRQGGAEQNFLYVSRFLAKCTSLPIDDLISLGSHHPKVAELLLKDLTNSMAYFRVGAAFAIKHASLRSLIAKNWQHFLEIFPLNKEDNAYLLQVLPELQINYPEFSQVAFDKRSTRHYRTKPQQNDVIPTACAKSPSLRLIMMPAPVGLLWYIFRRFNERVQPQSQSKTAQQPVWRRLLGR